MTRKDLKVLWTDILIVDGISRAFDLDLDTSELLMRRGLTIPQQSRIIAVAIAVIEGGSIVSALRAPQLLYS